MPYIDNQATGVRVITSGSAVPNQGNWAIGDILYDLSPTADTGPNMTTTTSGLGWICTVAGNPGTWKVFGDIAA